MRGWACGAASEIRVPEKLNAGDTVPFYLGTLSTRIPRRPPPEAGNHTPHINKQHLAKGTGGNLGLTMQFIITSSICLLFSVLSSQREAALLVATIAAWETKASMKL